MTEPWDIFNAWLQMAESVPGGDVIALATATKSGLPSVRCVLFKGLADRRLLFYTNYESRKGRELRENPRAAMVFYWRELARQIRIEGVVERVSESLSQNYFATRPRESQIGAWASRQSTPITGRDELQEDFRKYRLKFAERRVPCPSFWGGYSLSPVSFEFWQGSESRLHERTFFERSESRWRRSILAP